MEELKWPAKVIPYLPKLWEWIKDKSPIELKNRIEHI